MSDQPQSRQDILSKDALEATFPEYDDQIVDSERLPPREATTVPAEAVLRDVLAKELDNELFSHQATALERLANDENVVVTTSTSSGKTWIYTLQIARNHLDNPDATALLLYPMKALTRDQERELNDKLRGDWNTDPTIGVYDGDTSNDRKRQIRENANVILTNPAGLNVYLPRHAKDSGWQRFYNNLELIVVDEAHEYSGVTGTHVAWILRRLRRLLQYYDSDPQYVMTTATIGNPATHANRLTSERFAVVDEDGSPRGARDIVLWKPPIDEEALETANEADIDPAEAEANFEEFRMSAGNEAAKVAAHLALNGRQTLQFCSARQATEIGVRQIESAARSHDESGYVEAKAYHAGLGKRTRRGIEESLKLGELDVVASTNALELGIDIGSVDATVTTGYPGTQQSFWQQIGRAGRGTSDALSVLVGGSDAMDGYIMDNPGYLFDDNVEDAVVSIDNDRVYADHLLAAAKERPLTEADTGVLGDPKRFREVVEMWQDAGVLERTVDLESGVVYTGDRRPESRISMYSTSGTEFIVRSTDDDIDHEPIAEERAYRDYHEGALFYHDGQQYEVIDVEKSGIKPRILVEPKNSGLYTQTLSEKRITNLRPEQHREFDGGYGLHFGRGAVNITYNQFLIREISTGKVVDGPLPTGSPPLTLETELLWVTLPETHIDETISALEKPLLTPTDRAERDAGLTEPARYTYGGGIHAAEHGVIQLSPLELMIDNSDIGGLSMPQHPDDSIPGPVWFVHDGIDGGIGFSRAIYENFETIAERTREHLETCDCQRRRGCPLCVMSEHCGNENDPLDRVVGQRILEDVLNAM
jgi:DEAD/DEAH box helicase domain-containing protein